MIIWLVGGFNTSEKYWSNWIISPSRDENEKYLKQPPRWYVDLLCLQCIYNIFIFFALQFGAILMIKFPSRVVPTKAKIKNQKKKTDSRFPNQNKN